tara:strand:+ start:29 stop:658 length:630 start_codon:yes stop_codon:yes gene_type:complete
MGGNSSKQKEEEYKQSWGEYWTKNIKNEAIYGFLQKIMIESNLYEKGKDVTVSDVFKKHYGVNYSDNELLKDKLTFEGYKLEELSTKTPNHLNLIVFMFLDFFPMYISEKSKDGETKKNLLNFIDEVTKDENFKNNVSDFVKYISKKHFSFIDYFKEWLPVMIALIIITLILIIIYFIRKYKDDFEIVVKKKQKGGRSKRSKRRRRKYR